MKITFFDYIGAADLERVHSATIAWMVSDCCQELDIEDRRAILNVLFGVSRDDITSIETINEFKHIDIAFITNNNQGKKELWILKNKVKAPLGHNQLKNYNEAIAKDNIINNNEYYSNIHYSVLTLIDILPQDKIERWHKVRYKDLLQTLVSITDSDKKCPIILEYKDCLINLVSSLDKFLNHPLNYPEVFTGGSLSKDKKSLKHTTDFGQNYIERNGLETLFQKDFFSDIVKNKFDNSMILNSHVGESHGNADLAFHFGQVGSFKKGNVEIRYFGDLSFQNGAFKLAVAQENYPQLPRKGSLAYTLLKKWEEAFDKFTRDNPKSSYNRINGPKSRARVSLSFNIGKNWWSQLDHESFLNLIKDQLTVSQKILEDIVKTWNNLNLDIKSE